MSVIGMLWKGFFLGSHSPLLSMLILHKWQARMIWVVSLDLFEYTFVINRFTGKGGIIYW